MNLAVSATERKVIQRGAIGEPRENVGRPADMAGAWEVTGVCYVNGVRYGR